MSPTATTFAPFREPAYRRIWIALLVSNLGTFLQLTAAPWIMLELTGSPLQVSLVTTALTLPQLLFTLPAGALADAFDRRTVIIVGHVISASAASAMAALSALGQITPGQLLLLSFLLGTGSTLSMPAFQTLVPDLVSSALRAQAITLNSAAFNVARAVGPSLGGALVAVGLASASFGGNAISYLVVVGVLLTLPRQMTEDHGNPTLLRSAATGLRYVRFTRPLLLLIGLTAAFALTGTSLQALLPSVAADVLRLDAGGFGLLYGAFGVGALFGALTREVARGRFGGAMLPGSIITFGVAGVLFGLSTSPQLSAAFLAIAGLGWVWTMTTLNASVQLLAPRWVRGRVMSLYILAIGLQPLGALSGGLIAESIGAGHAVAFMTGASALLGLVAMRLPLPVLGEITEPAPPENWVLATHADSVVGSPIVVATTWDIDPARRGEFLEALRALRRVRLRTGAHRWELLRDADQPNRFTEHFTVHTWDEHLAQHDRIDAAAAAVLLTARSFDVAGGPVTRHLAGMRLLGAPQDGTDLDLDPEAVARHDALHESDGSVPLQ